MSSLSFIGDSTSYLRIPNVSDLNFGTGDFTIEWYQYQTDSNPFPRIFQMGSYDGGGISIGVSIEGGSFYYWTNGSPNYVINLDPSDYKNVWTHFAISRTSSVTQIFKNGVSIFSISDTNEFNSSSDLVIGNESIRSTPAAFGGYMLYFSWVKGVGLRTSDFTVPTVYPSVTSDYVLFLTASGFSGTLGGTVVNDSVGTVSNVPSGFGTPPAPPAPVVRKIKPTFTNNAQVYYKPGSLSPSSGGGVTNASVKARRT